MCNGNGRTAAADYRHGAVKNWIVDDKPCPIEKGGRVKMSGNDELVRTVDVSYNDIDINGHVNSVKYIEHVLDLWDIDWYREHRLKRFEIAYVAEAHQGDKMSFYREQDAENEYCVRLTKTDSLTQKETEVCRCRLVFI
jgi:acyl-ACP thioesterase